MSKSMKLETGNNINGLITSSEFALVCRVCLGSDGVQHSLFAPYQHSTVSALICFITGEIKTFEGDGLPDKICQRCLLELKISVKFRERWDKTNSTLLQVAKDLSQLCEPKHEVKLEVVSDNELDPTDYASLSDPSHVEEQIIAPKNEKEYVAPTGQVQCHDCGGLFKSKCKLRVHWKNTHNTYVCPICNRLFKSPGAFNRHRKHSKTCINQKEIFVDGIGKNRMFKCVHCHYETKALSTIRLHAYIHNGKRPFKCESCSLSFNQISSLNAHKERRHQMNVKQITCQFCGKVISGRNTIYKHLKTHSSRKYQCDICKKFLKSKDSLIGHLSRHTGVKSYTCELCAASYFTLSELCNHKRIRHSTKSAPLHGCNLCDYKSKRKCTIQKHQAKHTSSNFACKKCGLFFESALKLETHFSLHGAEKKFSCPICLHMFHRKDSVRNHVQSKHKGQVIKLEGSNSLKVKTVTMVNRLI